MILGYLCLRNHTCSFNKKKKKPHFDPINYNDMARFMAMRLTMVLLVATRVWMGLTEWLSMCFLIADDIARSIQHEELDRFD